MKLFSPAIERNRSYILEVLNSFLMPGAQVLEIASGTGQHGHYISERRPDVIWQPSDIDPDALASIKAWKDEASTSNFLSPISFDVGDLRAPGIGKSFDALVAINMIHISPWECSLSLLEQTRTLLKPQGILYLYGPFIVEGRETAPSNLDFDRSLRERDARWGIRNLEQVVKEAEARELRLVNTTEMPANNLSVIFKKIQGQERLQ